MIKALSNALFVIAAIATPAAAQSTIDTPASHAILMDYETGSVLFDKKADERMVPASMTKMMTSYIVFEKLKKGELTMDSTFTVSESAWGKGTSEESMMYADLGSELRIEDLLRGIIILSGNDACIVIAEGISGSEAGFAELMNEKAKELGMTGTHFANSHGLEDPNHWSTAHDMAILARALIRDFPEYYPIYAEKEFTWNKIKQENRNPLLFTMPGSADGLKTGHLAVSGYALTASAVVNGQRLILVVNGLKSMKERSSESKRLLEIGFREYKSYALFKPGDVVGEAAVWDGVTDKVPLAVRQPVTVIMRQADRKKLKATYNYQGPVTAPIANGQEIGTLSITVPGRDPITTPLFASGEVERAGLVSRIFNAVSLAVAGPPQTQ
jgi:D-alanyl-D-alanine carboxypeptidase (penicillin-binding protein 5/6)